MLAPVSQAGAPPTRQPLVSQVEMLDLPRASRAQKEPLSITAVVARVAYHVDRLGPAVDEDGDRRLAREGREQQAGYPREVLDADPWCGLDGGRSLCGRPPTPKGAVLIIEIHNTRKGCGLGKEEAADGEITERSAEFPLSHLSHFLR